MIGTKELYEEFIKNEQSYITRYESEITELNARKRKLVRSMENYRTFIDKFTDVKFDDLLDVTTIPTINTKILKNLSNNVGIDDFKNHINVVVGCNIRIATLNKKLLEVKKTIIPYPVFAFVLKEGNKLYIEQLLKGKRVSLGSTLGEIGIRRVKRKGLRPDWGASNKNKAELLAAGKTLYKKVGTDENGEPAYNDGVKWVVYHTEEYYYKVHWVKSIAKIDLEEYPNFINYVFKPTRSEAGLLSVMNSAIKNNPLAHLIFN